MIEMGTGVGNEKRKSNEVDEEEDEGMLRKKERLGCRFFLVRKKRFCRMDRLEGQEFCAEHIPTVTIGEGMGMGGVVERVACPLDPKQ